MGAQLIFSENNNSVCIKLANGDRTLYYNHKEEIISILDDFFDQRKIQEKELNDLTKEIILDQCILFRQPDKSIGDAIDLFFNILSQEVMLKKIKRPYIELCDCTAAQWFKHAFIYNENGEKISPPFLFKTEGYFFVKKMIYYGCLLQSGENRLKALIDKLDLPESFELN